MVVRLLDVKKDFFRPREDNEKSFGPEVPYLSAIGAPLHLANNTWRDITYSINFLERYSSSPTRRHRNVVKHIFRYLQGTMNMWLFYSNNVNHELFVYANARYLSNPHKISISNRLSLYVW